MTDLENLKAWMAANGYDDQSLTKAMDSYRAKPGMVLNMLSGKNPISQPFRFQFGRRFGRQALRDVFGIDSTNFHRGLSDRDWYPARYEAHRALGKAIRAGQLLPAKHYKCHACDQPATEYHHSSYHPSNHLCVVPLCRKCHRRIHGIKFAIPLGVAPTSVGLIRIAIAGLPS